MPKKSTTADAQIILQLYDFRREAEMRKARGWFTGQFWPKSVDDILAITNDFSKPENAWFRQVITYWDMAANLVLHGALNEELFFATNVELWFCFAKLYPNLKAYREKSGQTEAWKHIETLATRGKAGKTRMDNLVKRVAALGAAMSKK
jgi:hypothetical protein